MTKKIGIISTVFLFLFVSTSTARDWHVRARGRSDARTIQAAIDSATTGDVVILGNGTYKGPLVIKGKTITVRSQSGKPRHCIIDCEGGRKGILVSGTLAEGTVLRGLTVTNAGHGLYCEYGSTTAINCVFSGNSLAGIVVESDDTKIVGSEISNNDGMGIRISESGVELERCTISDNKAGGLSCHSGVMKVSNCVFTRNTGFGGLFISDFRFTLLGCTFSQNVGDVRGGGITVWGAGFSPIEGTVERCTFDENVGTDGGGVFFKNYGGWAFLMFRDCTFSGNSATNRGSALYCFAEEEESKATVTLENCVFPSDGIFSEGWITLNVKNTSVPVSMGDRKEPRIVASPNPFNPLTRIAYTLKNSGFTRVSVYDVAGRLVETLVSELESQGEHVVEWNAGNLPSGVYFCRLESGSVVQTQKLMVVK